MTAYRGPDDPELRVAWQRARRDAARRHHPDVGGDEAAYVEQMRRVDLSFATTDAASRDQPGRFRRAARIIARRRHRLRRRIRAVRGHLPRRVPGSRRYVDL